MFDNETFKDSLRQELRDEMILIIRESHDEHYTFLDIGLLNKKLAILEPSAAKDGLSENDWLDLVFELCPEVYDDLDFGPLAA